MPQPGLLTQQEPQPPQAAPQTQGAPTDTENQKKQFDRFVSMGTRLIHSEKSRDQIVDRLKGDDPQQALGETLLALVTRLDNAAKDQGVVFGDLVKVDGALELLGQLVEVGEKSGALPKMEQEQVALAFGFALQEYLKEKLAAGEVTPDELQQGVAALQAKGGQNGVV